MTNRFDFAFREGLPQDNLTYYFPFKGKISNSSSPYTVTFPPAYYLFELWGASGGGKLGGKGGYTSGRIIFMVPTTLYLYIGGMGQSISTQRYCLEGGWNGGGDACSDGSQTSGGGATDIRQTMNSDYTRRIIVAGGGGGAARAQGTDILESGGYGGGSEGGSSFGSSGKHNIPYGLLYSKGGTLTSPGKSIIKTHVFTNTDGSFGKGGNCAGGNWYCGGGGGGYFGGGGGFDVTGGGGGSGYIGPDFTYGILKNGSQIFPSKEHEETGYVGNGAIRITVLSSFSQRKTKKQPFCRSICYVLCTVSIKSYQ